MGAIWGRLLRESGFEDTNIKADICVSGSTVKGIHGNWSTRVHQSA